ncbi:MAG: DUF2723 domain-containing protein [bacterium]|nr:DUF2723 domain-containing protein [bacterium]
METKEKLSLDLKIAGAVFVLVFVVYLFTLCPGIYVGPSAEAVCDVKGAGLTPPISHPVWLVLGRFFASFSSNTAYMLNFMSALFGALTIAIMYLILSQFVHGRTAEEEARYQTQPFLRQVAAISASLLVAFSYPFWEGSVLAGSDTLNTFLLAMIVLLLWRYAKTSKARYAMLLGLVYGLALANYPTLLLLAPIFIVFLLVRGRGLLDDPVAFVATFLLFLLGLLPILYFTSRSYLLHAKPYVVASTSVGQAASAFIDSYIRSMKALFFSSTTWQDWIFWLFVPAFVPILFFMMKKGEYERGSDTATRYTYFVRYAFVALFTLAGLGYLWGYRIGPVGMARLDFLVHSRYLGSYVIVGAWFAYVMGYWVILASGRFKPTGSEVAPKIQYRKIVYVACVVALLALPVIGAVMSYEKSSKRDTAYIEDFAEDILNSCPDTAILLVPMDPYYGSIGGPLRYLQSQSEDASPENRITLIDLNAAGYDFYRVKRIRTAEYLERTVIQEEGGYRPDVFDLESPLDDVYDGVIWCEHQRAVSEGRQPRPVCGLVNNFFTSPDRAKNDLMNLKFTQEPSGLVYVYQESGIYRDTSEVIDKNVEVWEKRLSARKAAVSSGGSETAQYVAMEYSKSSNDLGVYCQLHGLEDQAKLFYRRSLEWYPENSSALWNLLAVSGSGVPKEETSQERRFDEIRDFGFHLSATRLLETGASLLKDDKQTNRALRYFGILRIASQMAPDNPFIREFMGDMYLSAEVKKVLSSFNLGSPERLALAEYTAAAERTNPANADSNRRLMVRLGRTCAKLGENSRAEQFLTKSLDEANPATVLELMEFYLNTRQRLDAIRELAGKIAEKEPANDEEKRRIAPLKWNATTMLIKALLRENQIEEAKGALRGYLQEHPDETDKYLSLAHELFDDTTFDSFVVWVYSEYAKLDKQIPVPSLVELANIHHRQGQYDSVLALAEPSQAGPSTDLAQLIYWKAMAYEALAKLAEAEKSYEQALSMFPEDSPDAAKVLNNLAWRYHKSEKGEQARRLAERALKAAPGDPLVWDTCGWILYRTGGDQEQARELLERAHLFTASQDSRSVAEILGGDAGIVTYHYGKLLLETGQKERGRRLIEMALAAGLQSPEELKDAQNVLSAAERENKPAEAAGPGE